MRAQALITFLFFVLSLAAPPSVAAREWVDKSVQGPDRIHIDVPAEGIATPMKLLMDQPSVEVMVHGEGPFVFLVDTGAAGGGRISRRLIERFGLAKVGEVIAGDPSGMNRETRDLVKVETLSVGGATVKDVALLAASDVSEDQGTDGILGFALFQDALLTLDYVDGVLRVERGELPEADGEEILEFASSQGVPSIEVDLAGTTVKADIDSGSMGWLMVPESVAGSLSLAGEPQVVGKARTSFNEFEIKQAPLDGTVRVGKHALESPPVDFASIFPRGNIGGRFLREFSVTFDQKNRRVRFRREGDAPIRQAPRYRVGVMFGVGPEGITVSGTLPGSAGERAGLKEGDLLLTINGQAVDPGAYREQLAVFGQPEPVALEVLREDKTVALEVTPEKSGG